MVSNFFSRYAEGARNPSSHKAATTSMASDKAGYMTGSIVIVDGGWTAYGYL